MANRGVHFALTAEQESRLLAAEGDDERVIEIIGEIEELWDEDNLVETDKAWDAIHRCFCNGKLHYEGGDYPLNNLIVGGRQLLVDEEPEATVTFVSQTAVADIAKAVVLITKEEMLRRYKLIKQRGYQFRLGKEDFEYTWSNFEDLVKFFTKAADHGRAVVFSVDC